MPVGPVPHQLPAAQPESEFDISSQQYTGPQYTGQQNTGQQYTDQQCIGQQYAQQSYSTPALYPAYDYHPYRAYVSQYHQQYATQPMVQMISQDENKALVSDGNSWKEYDLEKIFS